MYEIFDRKDDIVLGKFITYMKKSISNTRINYLKHQKYLNNNENGLNEEEWLLLSDRDNYGHFSFSYQDIFELFEDENVAIAFKNLTDLQRKKNKIKSIKKSKKIFGG